MTVSSSLQADEPVSETPAPQSPVPADETLAHFQLHPDCRIELVACEPDVIDPVHIAFDPDGRLWVVEYSDYPNGPGEGQPGLSRIRVLTDDDGDGRYGDAQVFADKLLFANGLTFWRDGVIVTLEGAVEFMRDTDGDGRADERLELFKGFTPENPQLRANHPTFALDNHIYIANGLRGGDVVAGKDWHQFFDQPSTINPEPVSLSGRDFRFDPLTGAYEAVSGMGQFGMSFDDWGNRFICSNRNPCDHVVLQDWYLKRNPSVAVPRVVENVSPAAENSRIYPISRFWTTSNLHAGQFTAACGICIYRGDALTEEFYGNSFVCDPTGNLVHRDVLEPEGATFTSHYGREGVEFLATKDEWCRPVNLTIGPDGALYVVDMYRAVIEHPQFMPDELKTRPDLLLGNDRGRIYRIVAKHASRSEPGSLQMASNSSEELTEALGDANSWRRETAHRLLLERQDESSVELIQTITQMSSVPGARASALWLLDGINGLSVDSLSAALNDSNPRVVEQAVKLAELRSREAPQLADEIVAAATKDDARLSFQCVLSLSLFDWNDAWSGRLADRIVHHAEDEWVRIAASISHDDPSRLALATMRYLKQPADTPRIRGLSALLESAAKQTAAQSDSEQVSRILDQLKSLPIEQQFKCVEALCAGWRLRGMEYSTVAKNISDAHQAAIHDVFAAAAAQSLSPTTGGRSDAVAVLDFAPWEFAASLIDVSLDHPEDSVRRQAIEVLARRTDPGIDEALSGQLGGQTPAIRSAVIGAMLRTPTRIQLLLDSIESGDATPREIEPARAEQLRKHADPAIRERALALLVDTTAADRQQVIAAYQPALGRESDPLRGQAVFIKNCQQCHRIGEVGVNVAPDISDSRTKTPAELLTSILDPNRAIDNNYFSYTILDLDGVVYTGVIAAETATSVTLKQAEGKEITLLRTDIDELKNNGVSLMPVGLEKDISVEQMADLISFIKNWRYLDGSVPREVIR